MDQFRTVVYSKTTHIISDDSESSLIQIVGATPAFLRFDSNPTTGYKMIVDTKAISGVFEVDSEYRPFAQFDP